MTLDFRSTVVFVSVFVTTTVALDEPSDPKPFLRGSLSFRPRLRGSRPRSRPAAPDAAPPRGRGSDALCGGAVDRSFAGDVQGKGGDSDFLESGIRHALAEWEGADDRIGVGRAGDRSERGNSGRGVGRRQGVHPSALPKGTSRWRI